MYRMKPPKDDVQWILTVCDFKVKGIETHGRTVQQILPRSSFCI